MTGFCVVIFAGFANEVKNSTAHSRLSLRRSIQLASYSEEKCSSSSSKIVGDVEIVHIYMVHTYC